MANRPYVFFFSCYCCRCFIGMHGRTYGASLTPTHTTCRVVSPLGPSQGGGGLALSSTRSTICRFSSLIIFLFAAASAKHSCSSFCCFCTLSDRPRLTSVPLYTHVNKCDDAAPAQRGKHLQVQQNIRAQALTLNFDYDEEPMRVSVIVAVVGWMEAPGKRNEKENPRTLLSSAFLQIHSSSTLWRSEPSRFARF